MQLNLVKGLSEKRITDLKKLNIHTLEDLSKHFPKSYLDLTKIEKVTNAYHNECILTVAKVLTVPRVQVGGRVKYVKVICSSMGDTFTNICQIGYFAIISAFICKIILFAYGGHLFGCLV